MTEISNPFHPILPAAPRAERRDASQNEKFCGAPLFRAVTENMFSVSLWQQRVCLAIFRKQGI